MWIKTLVMIIVIFSCFCLALADDPQQQGVDSQDSIPADFKKWIDFEINSDFGTYIAQIKALAGQQNISADKKAYTLIVSKITDGARQWFWQCNYDYDGHPLGMLTNDGGTFVYVSKYYNNKPLVKIYRLGSRIAFLYSGSFNVNPASLKIDKNGKLWLDQDSQGYQLVYRGRMPPLLEITTIDKAKYYISLKSGEIIPD